MTSAIPPIFSFALHLLSQGALLPRAIPPLMRITQSGQLLLPLGANHVQIGHDFQASDTCLVNAKLLNLWSFEQHRSHKHDRKRTVHVPASITEQVLHCICRLLSARVCRLLNVCLHGLLTGSSGVPSHRRLEVRCALGALMKSMGERHWARTWARAVVGGA